MFHGLLNTLFFLNSKELIHHEVFTVLAYVIVCACVARVNQVLPIPCMLNGGIPPDLFHGGWLPPDGPPPLLFMLFGGGTGELMRGLGPPPPPPPPPPEFHGGIPPCWCGAPPPPPPTWSINLELY